MNLGKSGCISTGDFDVDENTNSFTLILPVLITHGLS